MEGEFYYRIAFPTDDDAPLVTSREWTNGNDAFDCILPIFLSWFAIVPDCDHDECLKKWFATGPAVSTNDGEWSAAFGRASQLACMVVCGAEKARAIDARLGELGMFDPEIASLVPDQPVVETAMMIGSIIAEAEGITRKALGPHR